jgi:DNA transposition AAA+ family ATPase
MEIRTDIKARLVVYGKTMAALARAIDVNYEMLNRYLNGRAKMPAAVEEQIEAQFEKWNVQTKSV